MKVGAIALLVVACSGGDFQSAGGSAGVGGSAAGASSGGTGGSEPGAGGSSSGAGGSSSGAGGSSSGAGGSSSGAGGSSSGAGGVLGGVGGSAPGFGGSAGSASAGSGAGGSESTGGNGGGSSGGHGGAAGASSSGGSGPGGTGGNGSSDAVLWSETFTHHSSAAPQTAVTGVRIGLSVWRETDPPTECSDVSDVVAPGWTGVTEFDPGNTGACAKNPSIPSHRFWVYAESSTRITAGKNLEIPEGESLSWTVTKLRRTITENTWPTPAGGTSLDIEVKWEILGTQ